MSDASIVHISIGRLSTLPPTRLTFHHWSERDWCRTACGRPYETGEGIDGRFLRREMVAVRRDTADLIADPCHVCFGRGFVHRQVGQ